MASIFLSGAPITKTKEQRKLASLARRIPKRLRQQQKPSPAVVVFRSPEREAELAAQQA